MLLALVRCYGRKDIKLAALKRTVKAIEDFHFAFTAVASQPSSGGISSMYALHARELSAAGTPEKRKAVNDELIEKLRAKRPPREVFIAGFNELRASELYTHHKGLVTYVLRRFHGEHIGIPPEPEAMTIEHVANQGKAADPVLVATMVPSPPAPSSSAARAVMVGNSRTETRPERALRSLLHSQGFRFFKHRRPESGIRCRADVVFPTERIAVFVDGCFWHSCPIHGTSPSTNSPYWTAKLERNLARDRRNDLELTAAGWLVVRIWEHESPASAAEIVRQAVLSRR